MTVIRRGLCLLLCMILLFTYSVTACAEEEYPGTATGILDARELTDRVEEILAQYGVDGSQIAVGFYFTGTGDTYFYRGDSWIYSASLYKVPLYMALDNEAADGKILETGTFPTLSLLDADRDRVLINSVNSTAHSLMGHFDSPEDCRKAYCSVSTLPEDYYQPCFYRQSYFTARFMTDVMAWLYNHCDDYAKTLDSLYRSPLREDLASVGETYTIAQKYGDYSNQKVDVHHVAAIIDTPTPIVVVVMTEWMPKHRSVMNAIATMLTGYALELDEQLTSDK